MKRSLIRRTAPYLVLAIAAVLALFPISLMLLNSGKTNAQITTSPLALPDSFRFTNYLDIWTQAELGSALGNSLIVSLTTVLLISTTGSMAAYVLARKAVKGWSLISLYFLGTTTLPIQIFIFPLYFIFARIGIVDFPLTVSLIHAALFTPFSIFLLRTYFLGVPIELEESARVDGATRRQVFLRVVLPMVTPGIITVSLIVGLYSWNEFLISVTFLQSREVETAIVRFYGMIGGYSSSWGKLMSAATIIALPVVVFFVAMQRRFISGMTTGSVKG